MAQQRAANYQEFDLGKRGEKELEDINVIVEFCTMNNDTKEKCIRKIKELMSNIFILYFNNFS